MAPISEGEVQEVLREIHLFLEEKHYGPTIREILPRTRFTSPSTIKTILDRLERRGWIQRPRENGRVLQRLVEITEDGSEYL